MLWLVRFIGVILFLKAVLFTAPLKNPLDNTMKIFIYIIMALALVLLGYNVTKVNWSSPFTGDSSIAMIGILACACAIILLLILLISKKIERLNER